MKTHNPLLAGSLAILGIILILPGLFLLFYYLNVVFFGGLGESVVSYWVFELWAGVKGYTPSSSLVDEFYATVPTLIGLAIGSSILGYWLLKYSQKYIDNT